MSKEEEREETIVESLASAMSLSLFEWESFWEESIPA